MHTAPDIDIRKIKLTGNEKRFNDIRSNFYQILESAETFKQREILEKKPKYTNFLKNLNREQFKIPKKQEREAVKSEMYEFILNDQISHKVMTDDYKREAILDLKRELRDNLSRMAGPDDPQFYDKQFRSSLLGYKDEGKLRNNSENREKNQANNTNVFRGGEVGTPNNKMSVDVNAQNNGDMATSIGFSNDVIKRLENQRIKQHIENAIGKTLRFDDLDLFPTEIDDIVNIKEFSNPLGTIKEITPVGENLRKNGLIEHSILKQNYFYLDETQDINFYKDLSSYSRNVFKDPKKDVISLEIFDTNDLDFSSRIHNLTDQDMLNITSNHISEAILRSSLSNNKKFDNQIVSYEAKIIDSEFILSMIPKKENAFKRVMKDSKGSQTGNDVKIHVQEYSKEKDMTNILNTILKLKNLKTPLEKLPESGITIKKMKREVNEKIIYNLNIMAKTISGRNDMKFPEMIRYLMENMNLFKNQYCEGIPKLRLIKLLLIELAELKKEEEEKITNGELPPLRSSKSKNIGSHQDSNVLQPSRDSNNNPRVGNTNGGQAGTLSSGRSRTNTGRSFNLNNSLFEIPEDKKSNSPNKVPTLNMTQVFGNMGKAGAR